MERKMAEEFVKVLASRYGRILSLSEAMSMQKIVSDGLEVYVILKGWETVLARPFCGSDKTFFTIKIISW